MMSIIIPYRKEPNNGLELKYALRSIQKYLNGFKEIWIIGDCPGWVININHIDVREETGKNARNILRKILKGFDRREVGETVLQWQDDIFLTQPLQVKDIKYWYDRTLEEAIYEHHGSYHTYITNTALKITEAAKFYDIHVPIIYKKNRFEQLAKSYDWDRKNYILKTLYCSSGAINCQYIDGIQTEQMKDCKIATPLRFNEIKKKIGGSLFFSTSPQGLNEEMMEVFEELYPEKSNFEK